MEYTFEPHERIENILHVLECLQQRLNDSDPTSREVWIKAISQQLINLDAAVTEMGAIK